METWCSHHKPIFEEPKLEDYEDFLLQQLAAKPDIGYKTLRTALSNAKGVTFKDAPIRAWLAAHKGALLMPSTEKA